MWSFGDGQNCFTHNYLGVDVLSSLLGPPLVVDVARVVGMCRGTHS